MHQRIKYLACSALLAVAMSAAAVAQEDAQSKVVIGPGNDKLNRGAQQLLAGNAEEGVRLTHEGLKLAASMRERQAALGNLCAGYVLLEKYDVAMGYCNEALAERPRNWRARCNRALIYLRLERYEESERDLLVAEDVAPNARSVKEIRGLYLDATEPVEPKIEIDDRRGGS